jgi:Ni/Co efflux regulator RcnB
MKALFSAIAIAAAVALAPAAATAQESTARKVLSGQPAGLNKAKTEAQAKRDCQRQFRGAKESKSALRIKMNQCVQEQMQGN